jgi:hypothetical protein
MLNRYEEARSARRIVTNLSPEGLVTVEIWLRGRDLNPRPLGYEPNELPDCSTPRQLEEPHTIIAIAVRQRPRRTDQPAPPLPSSRRVKSSSNCTPDVSWSLRRARRAGQLTGPAAARMASHHPRAISGAT